jgi:hypothetical protein
MKILHIVRSPLLVHQTQQDSGEICYSWSYVQKLRARLFAAQLERDLANERAGLLGMLLVIFTLSAAAIIYIMAVTK